MSKAVPPSQQPSSPGLSEADRVSPSTAPERHLADPCVPAPPGAVSDNRPLAVPRTDSGEWTSQLDSFLCQTLCSGALNEREAIAAIRAANPDWTVTKMARLFSFNGVRLPDPNPKMTVDEVKALYATRYPELATAVVNGPEAVGDKMRYTFERAIGSKG